MTESITQYVLKVHSRCDLACDHCYVYEHADQSWRQKPRAISLSTADRTALRIAEHAAAHRLPEIRIILHGGEPLLLGLDGMRAVLRSLTLRIAAVARIDIRIHTNGVLLDERWCELFDAFAVQIGISLDGDRAANDRHRRFASGRSSHEHVSRALALLRRPPYRHLYAGILCTIDLRNDPIAVYQALVAQEPPNLDLLLPHATWENPPPRPSGADAPYGAWLTEIYRRWTADGRPVRIRLFESLISAARGGPSFSEAVGVDPVDLLVVDTDGSWEQPDSLKTAYHGAPATGLHVISHSVDEVARLPEFTARRGGLAALSPACRACPVAAICGGGLYAHRYRAENGFDNPSVYCADLKMLIGQVLAGGPERPAPARPGPRHELTTSSFDALAAGPGDVLGLRTLAAARLSSTRALVHAAAQGIAGPRGGKLRGVAAEGWALLCALDTQHPAAVEKIFTHPYTYAWAIRCLLPPRDADPELDLAHLAGLAAAAALRAGTTVRLPVPVRDGALHLPTMGALHVAGDARTAVVSVSPGRPPSTEGGAWRPARRLDGPVIDVALEDLDPFRDCQEWPAAGRLSPAEHQAWQRGVRAAGRRLTAGLPGYAEVLAAGLRAVVPLRAPASGGRSSTSRQAFGAVAVALPDPPGALDALLLHEFQHVKLHALSDLHDLFDPSYAPRLPVPWRAEPRPVEGVLHGAYAHLALAHLARSGGPADHERYVQYRSWVCAAAAALTRTGALTRDGARFVAGMHAAAEAPGS
jgi:uncharacterized protein